MANEINDSLPLSAPVSGLSEEEEIFGFAMTVAGAGHPNSPLHNWQPTEAERQEVIGVWRALLAPGIGRRT